MSKADDFYLIDICFDGDIVAAPNGDFQTINGIRNLKQALNNRLITVQGTLTHRPNYGVGIQLYQNAIAKLSTQQEIALKIKEQFERDIRVDKFIGISFKQMDQGKFIIKYKVEAKGVGLIEETFDPFGDAER